MKKLSRWFFTAACGVALSGQPAVFAADPAPKAEILKKPAPVWQMVIAPKYGKPVVADFHPEVDGSLSVEHRYIQPGESLGGPDAGAAVETAPAPAPAATEPSVEGPKLGPTSIQKLKSPGRPGPTASKSKLNPFRLTSRALSEDASTENAGPVLPPAIEPSAPDAATTVPVAGPAEQKPLEAPKPSNVVAAPEVTKPKSPQPTDVLPPTVQTPEAEKTSDEPETPAPTVPAPTKEAAEKEAPTAEAIPAEPTAAMVPTALPGLPGHGPSYAEIYFSIPFLRSEYEANPSYRHEATMEILLGQLRPTVIHKNAPQPMVNGRDYNYITPYRYWNGRGYVNYNFYYPRPSVYRQY